MFQKLKSQYNRHTVVTLLAILFIAYGGFATFRVIGRNFKLQQQVDQLISEIDVLNLRNQELEYEIAYFRTDAFIDKEARDKLGLKAPGEKTVILSDKIPAATKNLANQEQPPRTFTERTLNNFDQWLYFLFGIEPDEI